MYQAILNTQETEYAIKRVKDLFQMSLTMSLNLQRVTAPMIIKSGDGVNDDLNGEQPITFVNGDGIQCEVVHSLAKWKRMKLAEKKNIVGLYTDMNAIRTQEKTDYIHSIYVDQWDWEMKIENSEDRNEEFLHKTVRRIYEAIKQTENIICTEYTKLKPFLPEFLHIYTVEELSQKFNNGEPITPENKDEVEYKACKLHKAIFVQGIGDIKEGKVIYDKRAPDYDDWQLNGDIIIWSNITNSPIELSSMGIRVNRESLMYQLNASGHNDWKNLKYHKMILNNELPITIGGGIGQSRLCMLLLHKAHIGEVQSSVWTDEEIQKCKEMNVKLL